MKSTAAEKRRALKVLNILSKFDPEPKTALDFGSPVQLLVAVILSAQCTDARVNMVTPALFARFPDAQSLADADREELEELIKSTGFYRTKAKNIQACCRLLVERFGGEVPKTLDEMVQLPGVGRKTANVVLGAVYETPGITVDTHVGRLSRRLGFSEHRDPVKVERDLMAIVPRKQWTRFSHLLILHGRRACKARRPQCDQCPLQDLCPRIGVESS